MSKSTRIILVVLGLYIVTALILMFTAPSGADGGGGLAAALLAGFGFVVLLLAIAIWKVISAFQKPGKKIENGNTPQKWWKLITPVVLALGINAIMIEGYIGFSGFVNYVNGLLLGGLILTYLASPQNKRVTHLLTYAWTSVLVIIVYALAGYMYLGW